MTDTVTDPHAPTPTPRATAASTSAGSSSAATSSSSTSPGRPGSHILSADAFLRALQRDVAWDFFYGTVNFDGVIGTVNHYGTVDLFAGRFNDAYRKAELDHVENFETPEIKRDVQGDARRLDNGTSTRSPARPRPGNPFGVKNGNNTEAVTRQRVAGRRGWSACPATSRSAPTRPTRSTGMFADVPRTSPSSRPSPASRTRSPRSTCSPTLSRSDVTWNPSVVSLCKASLYCPTTEEYILPIVHGNDRVEWFLQLSDEIIWDVEDRDTGAKRAKVTMRAGDVAAMPADIRHQGYSPKRSMLLVWENAIRATCPS